jgi:hypothetical protein
MRARGVQLGIKKEPIPITGLIELKVFRVMLQVNSGEIIFTALSKKRSKFLVPVEGSKL